MRVICIDASNVVYGMPLVEGAGYDAKQSPYYPDSYMLFGLERNKMGGFASYKKIRFIPLSEISETEFERNYQKELV